MLAPGVNFDALVNGIPFNTAETTQYITAALKSVKFVKAINKLKAIQFGCAITLLASTTLACYAADRDVMAWGSKATDETTPFVTSLRFGCTDSPQSCIDTYKPSSRIKYYTISFAKFNDPTGNLERAEIYSSLSIANPKLREINIDDFMAFFDKINVPDRNSYLADLIDKTKSKNRNLNFGITLYEDQISTIGKKGSGLPEEIRKKIDRIALYLHYRQNWEKYPQYIAAIRQLFPNARIYGGVYHYDRRDYIGCRQGDSRKCSTTEEKELFQRALELQKKMLAAGQIQGLELYPGFIGNETSWSRWSEQSICGGARVPDCIQDSKDMGTTTLQLLKQ